MVVEPAVARLPPPASLPAACCWFLARALSRLIDRAESPGWGLAAGTCT